MVEIFGRCFRLLNKIVLNIEDSFFSQLCIKESDKLLSGFIFFLRCEGEECGNRTAQNDILQHKNIAKYPQIVKYETYVAQSERQLISRIKNILNLLDILKHLGLAKPPTPLLLEKDLLLLELSVLDISKPMARLSKEVERPAIPKVKKTNPNPLPNPLLNPFPKLGQAHREILEFIKNKERVQNLEVFSSFGHTSRRTLKRKLSELIKTNAIKRFTEGRKVFYSASAES